MARVTFTGRKLPLKLRNIAERESDYWGWHSLKVHAMKCSRGCAHGNARWATDSIRLYLATNTNPLTPEQRADILSQPTRTARKRAFRIARHGDDPFGNDDNRYLLIHELAHIASMTPGHGDDFYREAVRIARREGCLRGFLNWQGRKAKAYVRRARAAA